MLKIIKSNIPIGKVIKMITKDKNGNKIETTITRRSGKKIDWQKVCIHNTGNKKSTPKNEVAWLTNESNQRSASFHYVVDSDEIYEAIPSTEQAYHAGTSKGNNESVSIEVCESGDHNDNMVMASKLTAELLFSKGFGVERVTTHKSYSGKECPRLILPQWTIFIQMVQNELNKLKEDKIDYASLISKSKTKYEALDNLMKRQSKSDNSDKFMASQMKLFLEIYEKFEK